MKALPADARIDYLSEPEVWCSQGDASAVSIFYCLRFVVQQIVASVAQN